MKVNEKIRFLRENQNWSQEEMAHRLKMSTNGYSKIERGETRLTIPKLEEISEVFGIDVLELMSLGENNILFFQDGFSFQDSQNFFGSSQHQSEENKQLKQTIMHKDELIQQKDELLESQQREIETLRQLISSLQSKK